MNILPGSAYLGKGIDVFGAFDVSSVLNSFRLFDASQPGTATYGVPGSGVTYDVPAGVSAYAIEQREGTSEVFSKKSDFSKFISAEASLEGNYLAFSGEFEANFSQIKNTVSEYTFGTYTLYSSGYGVALEDSSELALAPSVKQDQDYAAIPTEYNEDTRPLFYTFLRKYGTHYVHAVEMGGRLYYNVAIDNSFETSEEDFKANISAEYKGVFGASGSSSVEWNRVSNQWADHRSARIRACGGSESILASLAVPRKGENHADALSQWISSISQRPGPMRFLLKSVDTIFSGAKAAAMARAVEDYCRMRVAFHFRYSGNSKPQLELFANGKSFVELTGDSFVSVLAALDRSTLNIVDYLDYTDYSATVREEILRRLKSYNTAPNAQELIIMYACTQNGGAFEHLSLRDVEAHLAGIGADAGLNAWADVFTVSAPNQWWAYSAIGVPGSPSGTAVESFGVHLERTLAPRDQYMYAEAFMEPQYAAGKNLFTPR